MYVQTWYSNRAPSSNVEFLEKCVILLQLSRNRKAQGAQRVSKQHDHGEPNNITSQWGIK